MEFHKVKTGKKKFGNKTRNYHNENSVRSYRNSQNNRLEQSTRVTCADCGDICQVPFIPKNNRPVFCSDCFNHNKPRYSGNLKESRYSKDYRRSERFSAKCANCGDDCDLPFKPKFDRPVYCSKCFGKIRSNEEEFDEDNYSKDNNQQKPLKNSKERSRKIKSIKKMESFYSGGSEKFYNSLKEKLFEILGGKICSNCGFKDEKALGFKNIMDNDFDSIQRSGFASSWGKYISDPSLAKEDLKILCLNCNAINTVRDSNEEKSQNTKKKKKRFPR